MKVESFSFLSKDGKTNIHAVKWMPDSGEYKAILQIAHGMVEYIERYEAFARFMTDNGYMVVGNDHLGHGSSVPPSGTLGFFGHHHGWSVLIDDVAKLTDKMKKRWPNLPYFLLGHSMGSMVARLYLTRYGQKIDGCILSGSPAAHTVTPIAIQIANSAIRTYGPLYRSCMINNLVFGRYNARIPNCQSPFDWLTRDRAVVSLYQSDAKCNFIFTASGFRDLLFLEQKCNRMSNIRKTPHNLPVLFLSGDADPVGNYGNGVKKIAAAYRAAGCRNIDVIFYKGGRHEILNEINKEEIYEDVAQWIAKSVKSGE